MDISLLQTFLSVSRTQNYTKTADLLGYAQSSVTSQIQKLEMIYGNPLFERIGKRMWLTHAGEELHRYALQIIALYEESLVAVKQPRSGSFSIGTFEITLASHLLPAYLGAFKRDFPQMTVVLQELQENDMLRAIRSGECDLGLHLGPIEQDSDIVFEQVREEEYVIIAPPAHPLAGRDIVKASDFGHEDVIVSKQGYFTRLLQESLMGEYNLEYRVVYEISSFETIKNCVMHGLGISIIPRSVVESERLRGNLSILPLEGAATRLPVYIAYHSRKRISPQMRHFIDSLRS